MTNTQDSQQASGKDLFPTGILKAPWDFWRANKLEALVFLVVNLLFGTVGLWLPPMNAFFASHSVSGAIFQQLSTGGLYIYAITFLSAIGGVTFNSIASEKIEHSRNLKVVLAGSVVVALFACTVLLQTQLFVSGSTPQVSDLVKWVSYGLQVVFGIVTTIVAIYVFSIVNNEQSGSAKDDIDEAARELLKRSKSDKDGTEGAWKS